MRRIRNWIVTAAVVLALLIPLTTVASADPGDGGFTLGSTIGSATSSVPRGK